MCELSSRYRTDSREACRQQFRIGEKCEIILFFMYMVLSDCFQFEYWKRCTFYRSCRVQQRQWNSLKWNEMESQIFVCENISGLFTRCIILSSLSLWISLLIQNKVSNKFLGYHFGLNSSNDVFKYYIPRFLSIWNGGLNAAFWNVIVSFGFRTRAIQRTYHEDFHFQS
jgi:hypothetical protein